MHRLVIARLRRRPARAAALAAGILVAATSFTLLTAAVRTSQLITIGIVQRNARSAYDILVRPPGTRSPLERRAGLVQDNFLSGIYGGITLAQYHRIAALPGVGVAAPVANLGYITQEDFFQVSVKRYLTRAPFQAYRLNLSYSVGNGQHVYADAPAFVYITRDPVISDPQDGVAAEVRNGRMLHTCFFFFVDPDGIARPWQWFLNPHGGYYKTAGLRHVRNAFDFRIRSELNCVSTGNGNSYYQDPVPASMVVPIEMPVLVAAIDPVAMQRLVGLGRAVVAGRMLGEDEKAVRYPGGPDAGRGGNPDGLPVLEAARPYSDEALQVQILRLAPRKPADLPPELGSPAAYRYLTHLPGRPVGSDRVPLSVAYVQASGKNQGQAPSAYSGLQSGPVTYRRERDGSLAVADRGRQAPAAWASEIIAQGFDPNAPIDNTAPQVRPLTQLPAGAMAGDTYQPKVVGWFNPSRLQGFSSLSQVPLETFRVPVATGADAASRRILHFEPLRPDRNLGGYLQQPPAMLTTLAAIPHFFSGFILNAGSAANLAAPVSSIMIRVAGVHGIDALSRARVKAVATEIHALYPRLALDVTLGSSPEPQIIDLPAGLVAARAVRVTERWAHLGVALSIQQAIDRKSAVLFVLILIVCALFLGQATFAAVRTRRAEIGTLRSLGWSSREVFVSVLAEPTSAGAAAGAAGAVLAALLAWLLGLDVPGWQPPAVFPVAILVALAAGILPAWRAARISPLQAINPPVRRRRRSARPVRGMTRLAARNLARVPGRTALGALGLALGICALTVLLAISIAYRTAVSGTLLGAAVVSQARGVDYLSAALAVLLGAAGAVDVLLISLRERTPELAMLRACGWSQRNVTALMLAEGLGIGLAGGIAGAAAGLGIAALLVPALPAATLATALGTAAVGGLLVTTAAAVPVNRLARATPAMALAPE